MRQQGLLQLGTHQFVKEGIAVGRVEFLPIEWYTNLHSDRHGVDRFVLAFEILMIHIRLITLVSKEVHINQKTSVSCEKNGSGQLRV